MPLRVTTCSACSKQFRLRWRIGKRKLEFSQVIRLNCPHCGNQFEIEGVKLVIFDAGAESFPITAIVDESCLVAKK
jgi:DNA-directed RNA polymerase subunit RPC12/RpoP